MKPGYPLLGRGLDVISVSIAVLLASACAVQVKGKSAGQSGDDAAQRAQAQTNAATSNATGTTGMTQAGQPSCTLSANPTTVQAGQNVTLTLHAAGFATATLNGLSGVRDGATVTVTPGQTSTYAATAFNSSSGATCTVTVNVTGAEPDAPTCSIVAAPANIVDGEATRVTMTTSGAVSSASLNGVSLSAAGGSIVLMPPVTTAVTGAVADGKGLTTNCAAEIKVSPRPAPTPPPPITNLVRGVLPHPEAISSGYSRFGTTTTVEVYFREPMDRATITDSSLTVSEFSGGPVLGTVSYDEKSAAAVFTPKQPFTAGAGYTAKLAAGVKSVMGNTQAADYGWFFRVPVLLPPLNPIQAGPAKPVIYLYPPVPTEVEVKLDYHGSLTATYPSYDTAFGGWRVQAKPDGTLINKTDGKEYNYLFWEGKDKDAKSYDTSTGFLVKGSDVRSFLDEKLTILGLSPRERNEFIVYWYPRMQNNAMNFVHFAGSDYTDRAKLTVLPKPDSVIRVFMTFKSVSPSTKFTEQKLTPARRHGFAVVEWGGTELGGSNIAHVE